MIFSTATINVNPPGEHVLTREQLWAALVLKARDARQFLPPGACTECNVVAEGRDFILRDAVIMGDAITELVTFKQQSKVSFHQVKSPREGVIVNEILEDASGALQLRFYAYLGLLGVAPDSDEEKQAREAMDSAERGYPAALRSTLARARQLVNDGQL